MDCEHKVISINRSGIMQTADIYYSRGKDWSLKIVFNDQTEYEAISGDVFSCFCEIRNHFSDVVFMCKGAKRNVYPSSMCRDMSGGLIAYEFHEGKHATSKDIVPIFKFDDEDLVSPAEQKQHFLFWAQSERC